MKILNRYEVIYGEKNIHRLLDFGNVFIYECVIAKIASAGKHRDGITLIFLFVMSIF